MLEEAGFIVERNTSSVGHIDLKRRLEALSIAERHVASRERAVTVREQVFKQALDGAGRDLFYGGVAQSEVEKWILSVVDKAMNEYDAPPSVSGLIVELEDWLLEIESAKVQVSRLDARLRYDAHNLKALDADIQARLGRLRENEAKLDRRMREHDSRIQAAELAVEQLDRRARELTEGEIELANWLAEANRREEEIRAVQAGLIKWTATEDVAVQTSQPDVTVFDAANIDDAVTNMMGVPVDERDADSYRSQTPEPEHTKEESTRAADEAMRAHFAEREEMLASREEEIVSMADALTRKTQEAEDHLRYLKQRMELLDELTKRWDQLNDHREEPEVQEERSTSNRHPLMAFAVN